MIEMKFYFLICEEYLDAPTFENFTDKTPKQHNKIILNIKPQVSIEQLLEIISFPIKWN